MSELEGPIYSNTSKINRSWITIILKLTEGTSKTINLTNLKGTLIQAYVRINAGIAHNTEDDKYVRIHDLTWEGTSIATDDNIAYSTGYMSGNFYGISSCGSTKAYDVTSKVVLGASNSYNADMTDDSPTWAGYGAIELVITYQPNV